MVHSDSNDIGEILKMTFNNYLPPKIYAFLVKLAEEHKLSVKEVQRIFLNKVAADLGFSCEHLRVGHAKEDPDHKPYCKDCWTRLETVRPPIFNGRKVVRPGEYRPLETFLDRFYKDQAKKGLDSSVASGYFILKNEN